MICSCHWRQLSQKFCKAIQQEHYEHTACAGRTAPWSRWRCYHWLAERLPRMGNSGGEGITEQWEGKPERGLGLRRGRDSSRLFCWIQCPLLSHGALYGETHCGHWDFKQGKGINVPLPEKALAAAPTPLDTAVAISVLLLLWVQPGRRVRLPIFMVPQDSLMFWIAVEQIWAK